LKSYGQNTEQKIAQRTWRAEAEKARFWKTPNDWRAANMMADCVCVFLIDKKKQTQQVKLTIDF
jgi:hypothetical protein